MSETAAAMLTCIQYPWFCRQTSETTGLTLQGLLYCHRAVTQGRGYVCVWGSRVGTPGLKSPPLIIRPCCLLSPPGPKFLTGLLCGENKSKGQPGYHFKLQKTGSMKVANDNTDVHCIHI